MFKAHSRRQAVERVMALKNAMVSGMWANSNMDDGKNTRQTALRELDEHVAETVLEIYGQQPVDFDPDNPFWAAMKVPKIDHGITEEEAIERERQMARELRFSGGATEIDQ